MPRPQDDQAGSATQLCGEPYCVNLAITRDGYCAEHCTHLLPRDFDRHRELDDDGWRP